MLSLGFDRLLMNRTTIRSRVASIVSQFVDSVPKHEFEIDNMNIVSDEMLDSFSVMSVIAIVEDEFDIQFTPDDLSSERMRTFSGMFDLIEKKNAQI